MTDTNYPLFSQRHDDTTFERSVNKALFMVGDKDYNIQKQSFLQKFLVRVLGTLFVLMILTSVAVSTTFFAPVDADKMLPISLALLGVSCLFGCGVYSFASYSFNSKVDFSGVGFHLEDA